MTQPPNVGDQVRTKREMRPDSDGPASIVVPMGSVGVITKITKRGGSKIFTVSLDIAGAPLTPVKLKFLIIDFGIDIEIVERNS